MCVELQEQDHKKLTNICEIKALSPSGVRINCKKAVSKADKESCE